jgi:hypothetical protein
VLAFILLLFYRAGLRETRHSSKKSSLAAKNIKKPCIGTPGRAVILRLYNQPDFAGAPPHAVKGAYLYFLAGGVIWFPAMSDSFNNPTPQFGTAEYVGKAGNDHCQFCQQQIAGEYYRANDAMACGGCAAQLRGELAKDTHAAFMRALLFGVGAAVVGLIAYATFEIATGIVIGYASLAVGWLVGKAMMKGSNGVGGRRYQITAVLLTYAAVSMAAIPIWIYYAREHRLQQTGQQKLQDEQRQLEAESGRTHSDAAPKPVQPRIGFAAWVGRVALLGLASPFLDLWETGPSISWAIGLLILFVGMRFAWKITAGLPLKVYGPFANT